MKFFTRSTLFQLIDEFIPERATIVEAGAFDGRDTKKLAHWRPSGHIHAFEPLPEICSELNAISNQLPNVTCYPCALSNQSGKKKFYVSEHPKHPGKPFQAGSLCVPTGRLSHSPVVYPRSVDVSTITLDEWAQQHTIDTIDFLWLDVQGHTLEILKAAPNILRTVSVLYTEVDFIDAYEGQATYKELVAWLSSAGFRAIGKDFRTTDGWFFGNLIFVRS